MNTIRFVLSPDERKLVLEHGYPFDDFRAALEASKQSCKRVAFELSRFYFEHLIGEIARSGNHAQDRALEAQLGDLFEKLEEQLLPPLTIL